MKRWAKHRPGLLRDRRGVTALEFAAITTSLMLLCYGSLELGLLFWTQTVLNATAARTARCVAIGSADCSNAQTYAVNLVTNAMFSGVIGSTDVTSQAVTSCNGTSGTFQKVSISSSYLVDWQPAFVPALNRVVSVSACYPK
jgi:Flp pilus assembly protein TadG